ncbi:MAG: hypothetical protein MUF00_01425 [Gemmatimonadaceae bacterium]|jgi:hypothetical protein|nr:hypothetical protein [Gemmatimonadaceae bacterium]
MSFARTAWTDFLVAAITTACVHQPLVAVLHALGMTPWIAFDVRPTAPLGVPAVLSAMCFGGLWGVPLGVLARRWAGRRHGLLLAAVSVASSTVIAGAALAFRRGHGYADWHPAGLLAAALVINMIWATVTAWLRRDPRRPGRGVTQT